MESCAHQSIAQARSSGPSAHGLPSAAAQLFSSLAPPGLIAAFAALEDVFRNGVDIELHEWTGHAGEVCRLVVIAGILERRAEFYVFAPGPRMQAHTFVRNGTPRKDYAQHVDAAAVVAFLHTQSRKHQPAGGAHAKLITKVGALAVAFAIVSREGQIKILGHRDFTERANKL